MSAAGLAKYQWSRIRCILEHAYTHIPFYRQRFQASGLVPDDIRTVDDFRRFPILTRRDLQHHSNELLATNIDVSERRRDETGGSTGNPVVFYQHRDGKALQRALIQRSRSWAGFREGDKVAIIWGADRDIPLMGPFQRFRLHHILRQRWLNAYALKPEAMEAFAHLLLNWKPRFILAYANALYLFACFLRERGLDRIRPRSIETSAETLWDYQREYIEDVFKCKVYNSYGSRDANNIAYECEQHKGLHVLSDNVHVEIMNGDTPAKPGEIGDIIVTTLHNEVMPLIRYQIQDMARATDEHCPCGRPFPLVAEILGRSNDVITTPDGQMIHGAFFNHLFFGTIEGVRQFQVRQKSLHELDILVLPHSQLAETVLAELRKKVEAQVGDGVDVTLRTVEAIPPAPSGKHRYMISDVPPPFVAKPS